MDTFEAIRKVLLDEKNKYDDDRAEFYANPDNWANNKRRMHGMKVIRGKKNKGRIKDYKAFHPSDYAFTKVISLIEEEVCKSFVPVISRLAEAGNITERDVTIFEP